MESVSNDVSGKIPSPVARIISHPDDEAAYRELVEEIKGEISQHRAAARWKSGISQLFVLTAIVTSTLASVNAASGNAAMDGLAGGVLAVVPAATLLIARTLKYESRARWHKLKQRKLEAFYRELRFQKADPNELSKRLSVTLERLDTLRTEVGVPDL